MLLEIEQELFGRIVKQPALTGETPRDVIRDLLARGLIKSPKQAWATLEKWSAAGLYDYGVALDMGWLNEGAEFPRRSAQAQRANGVS